MIELKGEEDDLRRKIPPAGLDAARAKTMQAEWTAMNTTTQDQWAKVKAATDRLVALAKPVSVEERVVNFDNQVVPKDTILKGDSVHGKQLFTEKGCMACHSHTGTEPGVVGEANFGPNLSRVAAKLGTDGGNEESKRRWLVQWLLNPNVHNPRTKMPITFLKDQDASDIASWLLSQEADYKGKDPTAPENETLVEMARMYLAKAPGMTAAEVGKFLPKSKQADALPSGIDDEGVEIHRPRCRRTGLLTEKGKTLSRDKLLWYIRQEEHQPARLLWLSRRPGFETAKPISLHGSQRVGQEGSRAHGVRGLRGVREFALQRLEHRDDVKDKNKADPKWKSIKTGDNGEGSSNPMRNTSPSSWIISIIRGKASCIKSWRSRSFDYNRIRHLGRSVAITAIPVLAATVAQGRDAGRIRSPPEPR